MDIRTNIPLKNYVTMKLGGPARFMADIHTPQALAEIYKNSTAQNLPVAILGGGSNTIVKDEGWNGIVLRMRIPGIEMIADDLHSSTFKVGAGVVWDDFVKHTVDLRLTGIEAMSGIPGTVGAAPVQNVGAYGQDVSGAMISLEAYDTLSDEFATLEAADCQFSYRNSIFRDTEKGRFVITSATFQLSKNLPAPPFYEALQKYLDDNSISVYTHQVIRDAVLAIRAEKLPDPSVKPNTGSFFKNAIIEQWRLPDLQKDYPDLPFYDMGDGHYKIPSGWLIDQAGFKGQLISGIRVHDKNALVLINESATSYADLDEARETIATEIRAKFQISLEQEPLEL